MTTISPAEELAFIICVMDAPAKYPGEKTIDVVCPFCKEIHKHLGAQLSVRVARCDPTKSYRVYPLEGIKR